MKYDFHKNEFIETDVLPGKLAIAGSDGDIDWQTLKRKIEKLVNELTKFNVPKGHPVMIYGHKEYSFPAAILACIHSSIPYIPVDRIYPVDRIKKIIDITGTQVLINCSQENLDIDFPIRISSNFEGHQFQAADFRNKIYGNSEDPLRYIMFTSGSTGEPKGVQITAKAILKFIDWSVKDFGFKTEDIFMNQAPFTFDVSLSDIFNSFALGASLVLNSNTIIEDQEEFLKRISNYKCSVWTSTPSFAYLFLRHPDFNTANLKSIHTFLFIGEELPNRTCSILKTNFKSSRILNAYGPTEATIVTTLVEITEDIIQRYKSLPIGFPMPGSELLIEKSSPENKEGELIIVGDHVSIGYFKKEELNANKFFIHNGKRAFRTGDISYYENGLLFFLGRNDDQVKMRGFRIELEEISNVICKHELILDAVTIPLKRNNEVKKIVSFVKIKSKIEINELKIKLNSFLELNLPHYMIPGDIVIVNEFPYNSSHKIDKNKIREIYLEGDAKT